MSAGNWMTSLLLFATYFTTWRLICWRPAILFSRPPDQLPYPPAGCISEFLIGREKEDRLGYIQKPIFVHSRGPCCSLLSPIYSSKLHAEAVLITAVCLYICVCVYVCVSIRVRIPFRFLHTNFAGGAFFRSEEPSKRGRSLISVGCQQWLRRQLQQSLTQPLQTTSQ